MQRRSSTSDNACALILVGVSSFVHLTSVGLLCHTSEHERHEGKNAIADRRAGNVMEAEKRVVEEWAL